MKVLVTGGAGYFGEILCKKLVLKGFSVKSFDLNQCSIDGVETIQNDIRDTQAIATACQEVEVIYHNVAQVPLAKNKDLFWSVNRDGVKNLIDGALKAGCRKIVYTSSSAVFGIPKSVPVFRDTSPFPAEDYGAAKLAGETLCLNARKKGLEISIIRPRTILGHGRLGILQILFEWISKGQPIPVFNGGHNLYQFVHADDLANACVAAGQAQISGIYNIGSEKFGSMRNLIEGLIQHAGTNSCVKSLPARPLQIAMTAASVLGLSPLGAYHSLMYGETMFFDIEHAKEEIGYAPQYSDSKGISESYDAYLNWKELNADLAKIRGTRSHHLSPVKKGILTFIPPLLRLAP